MPLLADVAVAAEVFVLGGGLPVTPQGTYIFVERGFGRFASLRGGVMGGRARTADASAGFTAGRLDACARVSLGPVRFALGCVGLAVGGTLRSGFGRSGFVAPVIGLGVRVPAGVHFELASDVELLLPIAGATLPAISWGVGPCVRFL